MRKSHKGFVFALVLVVALLLSSTSLITAQETKVLRTAYLPGDVIIDPALGTWMNEIQLVNMMYIGLTTLHETTVEIQPGFATDWSVSDDGLVYTFNLLHDVPWVRYDMGAGEVVQVTDENGNVRVVTAHDFVYGINRTLDPDTGSQYAPTLARWVVGGMEMLAGEDVELGVAALDDYTLEIRTPRPAGYLGMIYGMWMSRPHPQWAIEEYGDAWTEAGNIETYGPYTVKSWEHDVQITITKNPFWPGTDYVPPAIIDDFEFVYLEDPAMLAAFEAGELDWIPTVPLPDLDRMRVEYPDELRITSDICTYYYGFNTIIEPTDNVHMRRALSMAIDRATVVAISNGGQIPAGFFTRPDVAPGLKQEDYPDMAIWSDPEGAKAELALYFEETGTTLEDLPPITLMHNTSAAHAIIAQAVQQMWKETLGIEVQITSQDAQVFNETLRRDAPAVYRAGWCYDYPDASSFIGDVYRSVGPDSNNHTNWGPQEFFDLLDEAAVETDTAVRRDLYAQAEGWLVNEAAAIAPIYYYTTQQMTQTYVDRTYDAARLEKLNTWDINR
ncbi:MAG: peptide ABC transporter substrate-binding protein [Anaerolineae bacterium]|nr:peptide ABC transporter substrate-binding protein [Anaerolineae bacterium]